MCHKDIITIKSSKKLVRFGILEEEGTPLVERASSDELEVSTAHPPPPIIISSPARPPPLKPPELAEAAAAAAILRSSASFHAAAVSN